MSDLRTSHPLALQFLMTEDLYHTHESETAPIAVAAPAQEAEKKEQPAFDYLGENNRYMLLLVNSPGDKIIAAKELEALQNILQAKKMDIKDVAIVNPSHYPGVTIQQLKDFFACNTIVAFGMEPSLLNIPDAPLNTISTTNGVKVLPSYGFAEMLLSVDKKREFWNEMKKL